MNNKFLTYGLIIIVAFIWSYIFYSIWMNVFSEKKYQEKTFHSILKKDSVSVKFQSYKLKLNYADPFTKQTYTASVKRQSSSSSSGTIVTNLVKDNRGTTVVKPNEVVLPKVKYVSSITNQKTKKVIAIINIEEREYMCSNGDVIENVQIQNIGKDSIQVEYQKIKWYVKK